MSGRPRIGITRCSKMADYEESVRRAGGEPVVIDWGRDSVDGALENVSGLLLTGGPDVDAKYYGEPTREPEKLAEPERDAFELELVRQAIAKDTPLLAICRGMQVLNVAAGGSLVQDIPSVMPASSPHDVKEPKDAAAHRVHLEPGSNVSRMLRAADITVNSRHHQAVHQPGPGLVVTATAPDGVVEAVEKPDARFCVGVEWHPENYVETGEFLPLFRGLVEEAAKNR